MTRFHARRLRHFVAGSALAFAVIAGSRVSAEVVDSAPNGFTVRETVHVAAGPDKVYAALIAPQRWWSPHHTFSDDASNLTFDAKAGGCWCETLPNGGSVQHMTVVYVVPGKALRLRGAMGPMQSMAVENVMDWSLKPAGDGTDIVLVGTVGGYVSGGLDKLGPVVDHVFGEQISRLKTYIETGAAPK